MGNQPSGQAQNIFEQINKLKQQQAQAQVPAPDPRADIEKKRVELNMSKNDTKRKQDEFDKLVPTEAQQRVIDKAKADLDIYVDETNKLYSVQMKLFDQTLDQIVTLTSSPTYEIVQKYKNNLEQKQQIVSNSYMLNKEKAFTERRRFLDSDPQEGVSGIGWLSTVDEQILAVFWLSYIIFIGTGIIMVLAYYGEQYLGSLKNMAITGLITFAIFIYIGHTSIRTFAMAT